MAEVVWTRPSQQQLREIRRFIARDSERYAQLTVERIQNTVRRLEEFPQSGRTVPEVDGTPYREVIAGSYRAVYRYDQASNRVFVVAIVHDSRQLPPLSNGPASG